jgi:hypothetical protein
MIIPIGLSASFRIKPKKCRYYFVVLVFETKLQMWEYYKLQKQYQGFEKFGAICQNYEIVNTKTGKRKSEIGEILFSKSQLGAGTIAHEIGHAAFHYDRLINGNETATYGEKIGESEERVLYLLAEMVKDCIDNMYKAGVL